MSGSNDYIPGDDAGYTKFLSVLLPGVEANYAVLGLTQDDVTALQKASTEWTAAYQANTDAAAKAHAAAEAKSKARTGSEQFVRWLVKKINTSPSIDNALRAKIGLSDHATTKTTGHAPTTHPLVRVEAAGHFALTLHLADSATPASTAKPHGVAACKIYIFVGETAPADPSSFTYLADVTRATYTDTHPAADAGKTAHYACRWVNAKMEPGPWSEIASAKIPV
jgi:hypothetical protein